MKAERVSHLAERLRQRWHRSMSRRRAIKELAACPPSEFRRFALDAGLSDEDLRQLCTRGPSDLLSQRLQLLRLDPEYVLHAAPRTYRDLVRVCAYCQSARRCARDLARGDVQAGMDAYCLNGASIDALTTNADGTTLLSSGGSEKMRWWMTRRVERQATRTHEMMDRLDVDGAALARARRGELYAQARRRCVSCGTTDKCLRWLDEPPKSGKGPDFCPNLSLFDAYRRKP